MWGVVVALEPLTAATMGTPATLPSNEGAGPGWWSIPPSSAFLLPLQNRLIPRLSLPLQLAGTISCGWIPGATSLSRSPSPTV